jgi:hypothetical protein
MLAVNAEGSVAACSFCFSLFGVHTSAMMRWVRKHDSHTRHHPIDTLLAVHGAVVVSDDMTAFITRIRDLHSRAPAAAEAAAAAARKSLDFPILLSFVITAVMAFLFQSIVMRSSNAMSVAAAVLYSAAPAMLVYPHR